MNGWGGRSVFLVTVHDPICTETGNLQLALYGSFLPLPAFPLFPPFDASIHGRESAPGYVRVLVNSPISPFVIF